MWWIATIKKMSFFSILEKALTNDHVKEAPALVVISSQNFSEQFNRHHLQSQPPQPQPSSSTTITNITTTTTNNTNLNNNNLNLNITSTVQNHINNINNNNSNLTNMITNNDKLKQLTPPLASIIQQQTSQPQLSNSYNVILSRTRTTSLSSTLKPITANGVHVIQSGEDSSQSSLNLSASSGYLSGSSANSSVGGTSNLNLSVTVNGPSSISSSSSSSSVNNGTIGAGAVTVSNVFNGQIGQNATITMNGVSLELGNHHQHLHSSQILVNGNGNPSNGTVAVTALPIQPQQTNSRRRTISSNSNGYVKQIVNTFLSNRIVSNSICFIYKCSLRILSFIYANRGSTISDSFILVFKN